MSVPVAVVIGLDSITGLQTARILARRGVPVVGIASNARHFAASTNACLEVLQANTSGAELITTLARLSVRLPEGGVVVPCTDNSVRRLSAHRSVLAKGYRLTLPEHGAVETLMNKQSFYAFARKHGFRVPATFDLRDRRDLEQAMEELRFPCVLKPALKDPQWTERATAKAFKAGSAEELARIYDRCANWSRHLIAQEWIEGPESELYSCNVYFGRSGQPLVTFVARKIRQWPPQTGTSALGAECRADEVLNEAVRLFKAVGYSGLGYVEMKRDVRTGEFVLIEPNIGRPTGRSAIAEAGGVELLYTMYCDLTGRSLPAARSQRYGNAKWIYLRHDVQAAVHAWRRGELTIPQWISSLRGKTVYAVLSIRDPLPFVLDIGRVLGPGCRALAGLVRQRARHPRDAATSSPS